MSNIKYQHIKKKSSQNFIAIGTDTSRVFMYNNTNSLINIQKSPDPKINSPLYAIDISYDEELLICGYSNGKIGVYSL